MKFPLISAAALALMISPAFASGYSQHSYAGAPQFANASAVNYAAQVANTRVGIALKGNVEQNTSAYAEAKNRANCYCNTGAQVANANAKNMSVQIGSVSGFAVGSSTISQSSGATALATNVRR